MRIAPGLASRPLAAGSLAAVPLAGLLLLSACTPGVGTDAQGGPGLPVQLPGDQYAGDPIAVTSPLLVGSEGCFRLAVAGEEHFVIWPAGFTMAGDVVVTDEGDRVAAGDEIVGEGLLMPVEELYAIEGPDGYWASVAGYCVRNETSVLVLESAATPAR